MKPKSTMERSEKERIDVMVNEKSRERMRVWAAK
jgi:hypothetical protein